MVEISFSAEVVRTGQTARSRSSAAVPASVSALNLTAQSMQQFFLVINIVRAIFELQNDKAGSTLLIANGGKAIFKFNILIAL